MNVCDETTKQNIGRILHNLITVNIKGGAYPYRRHISMLSPGNLLIMVPNGLQGNEIVRGGLLH